jgi:D-alanyl-lipoteichoic acid acyltransferase DltB (MBOAT superfamily)
MLFNSLQFCIFFPLVTAAYFLSPHRLRWLVLLLASVGFYMAFVPAYIAILGFTIVVDYVAGIVIETAAPSRRKAFLVASLFANIGVLFVFKYYDFVNVNLHVLAAALHWNYSLPALSIALPIGLSFHTFQAMSYTIEVYRGRQKAERHFGIYALYVMFYPQLVAGPIERPQNLLHQFHSEHAFDYRRVTDGLRLMAWGFFKKLVIADRLATMVNLVYGQPTHYDGGAALLVATYFFAIQIYCDFSGYSDIALGAAEIMGFKLMRNFDRPYAAESMSEFWRRWHISLSTWFRDYLFVPLREKAARDAGLVVGRRPDDYREVPLDTLSARWRRYRDLSIVFLVSGLWHGASWNFVIWGALHAFYIVFALATRDVRARVASALGLTVFPRVLRVWRIVVVFHLTLIAWIFFRASTLHDALYIVTHALRGLSGSAVRGPILASTLGVTRGSLALAVGLVVVVPAVESLQARFRLRSAIDRKPAYVRWALYYAAVAAIVFLGEFRAQEFIYFQF